MNEQEALKVAEEWKKRPGVLNVAVSHKIVNGKLTDVRCITVYVEKKIAEAKLKASEIIPKEVKGMCTDVIELSTKDFKIGQTSVAKLPWEVQKRLAGGVTKK